VVECWPRQCYSYEAGLRAPEIVIYYIRILSNYIIILGLNITTSYLFDESGVRLRN
jgi:hypothetical protein